MENKRRRLRSGFLSFLMDLVKGVVGSKIPFFLLLLLIEKESRGLKKDFCFVENKGLEGEGDGGLAVSRGAGVGVKAIATLPVKIFFVSVSPIEFLKVSLVTPSVTPLNLHILQRKGRRGRAP